MVRLVLSCLAVLWLGSSDGLLLGGQRCAPTAIARGACHDCVCAVDGMFHCRARACKTEPESIDDGVRRKECEPRYTYRDENLICTCSEEGFWRSSNCRAQFRRVSTKINRLYQKLRTNIACTPKSLYLLDCNICECGEKGIIELSSCTHRRCKKGSKVDICSYGDILRTENEVCACSDIDLYVDRLCFKVKEKSFQEIQGKDVESIIEIADTSLQHEELPEIKEGDPCVPNRTYRIDCNTCRCGYNNRLFCTKMACISRDHVDKFREKVKKLAAEKEKGKEKKKNFNKKKNYQKNVNEFKLRVKDLKTSDKESEDMMVKRGKENKDNANGKNPKKTVGKGYKNKVKSNKKDVPELTEADENKDNNYKKTMRAKVDKEYESVVKINKKGLQDLHEEVENKDTNINDDKPTKVDETHKNHEKNPPDVSERDEKKDTDVKESKRTRVDEKDKSFVKNKKGLPDLPEGACVPGKFYQNECYGCYCEDTKIAVCSNKQRACEPNHRLQIPHDVRPAFTALELASLPSLPHMASRCTPGRAYRVSCNTCLCLPSRSLLCDQLLCLSQDDINRIDARKKTGTPCKNDDDIPTSSCVKCSCVDGRASCEHRIGCQLPSILRQLTKEEDGKPQMTLDVEKDKKCLPFTVYKNNCNKCYCQEDETLRCTLKVCLNYVESLKLKKHRLYLEKQGL